MQHNLPVLFFLTLAVYIRTNRNPRSPLLDETGSNQTGLFSRLLETCCWKIVPSPCGCISTEPKLRLFIMGEEGLTTLSRIDPTDPLFRRSFFYFRDRPGISTASSFYRRAPSPSQSSFVFRGASFPSCGSVGDREISRHRYFFTGFSYFTSSRPFLASSRRKFFKASDFFYHYYYYIFCQIGSSARFVD